MRQEAGFLLSNLSPDQTKSCTGRDIHYNADVTEDGWGSGAENNFTVMAPNKLDSISNISTHVMTG